MWRDYDADYGQNCVVIVNLYCQSESIVFRAQLYWSIAAHRLGMEAGKGVAV